MFSRFISEHKKALRTCLFLFLLVIIALTLSYWNFISQPHIVIPNNVFRSAQLNSRELKSTILQHHIRSIINLRGENDFLHSYQSEIHLSQKLGVQHFDLRLSSHARPSSHDLQTLIHLIQTVPRPVLLHCESGSDRTGLASAIALVLSGQPDLSLAKRQFSIRYFVFNPETVGRLVFSDYSKWLKDHNLKHSKSQFLAWAATTPP